MNELHNHRAFIGFFACQSYPTYGYCNEQIEVPYGLSCFLNPSIEFLYTPQKQIYFGYRRLPSLLELVSSMSGCCPKSMQITDSIPCLLGTAALWVLWRSYNLLPCRFSCETSSYTCPQRHLIVQFHFGDNTNKIIVARPVSGQNRALQKNC